MADVALAPPEVQMRNTCTGSLEEAGEHTMVMDDGKGEHTMEKMVMMMLLVSMLLMMMLFETSLMSACKLGTYTTEGTMAEAVKGVGVAAWVPVGQRKWAGSVWVAHSGAWPRERSREGRG